MSSERNKQMLFPIFGGLLFAVAFLFLQISEDGVSPVDLSWMIPIFPIISFLLILLLGFQDPLRGGSIPAVGEPISYVFYLSLTTIFPTNQLF